MSDAEKRLLEIYSRLPEDQQVVLSDYAEFLFQRHGQESSVQTVAAPLPIERPAQESVVGAIKRLRKSYAMLDHGKLLHEASALMAKHIVKGEPADQVIDELEELFASRYQRLKEKQ